MAAGAGAGQPERRALAGEEEAVPRLGAQPSPQGRGGAPQDSVLRRLGRETAGARQ
jgi:hypothetical protein